MLKIRIGEKIGIQRTNIPGHKYILRRIRTKRYFDTTKKKNQLNPELTIAQKQRMKRYMQLYRKKIYIAPWRHISNDQHSLIGKPANSNCDKSFFTRKQRDFL